MNLAQDGQFIPITLQRAKAHAANPAAHPDDAALLVAYLGQELVGFFGILPITLKRENSQDVVYWFSTWRVQPQLRGKSVGSLLMKEALSLGLDFMIVGSGPARKVCRRFGFLEREPLVYYQLDLTGMSRLNPAVWLSRLLRRLLKPFKVQVGLENKSTRGVAKVLSPFTRPFFTWLLERRLCSLLETFHIAETAAVRMETDAQLASLAPVQFYRGAEIVNWMRQYPWVVEPGQSPTERMDFYFSDVRQRFRTIALEFSSAQNEYLGYVVCQISTIRGRLELKILDVALEPGVDRTCLLALALRYARQFNVERIDLPAEAVGDLQKSRLGKLLLERRERIYQCYPKAKDSPLALAWESIHFQYSDGDMPFS